MDEQNNILEENDTLLTATEGEANGTDSNEPIDKNIKLMSPTQMVIRRFFRSKLSVIGLVMVIGLFVFSFLGPFVYTKWEQDEPDKTKLATSYTTIKVEQEINGETVTFMQTIETVETSNKYASPSWEHPLGTDDRGFDVLARLMYGGRVSLIVSFLAVFMITALGIVLGGIAGYFGGWVDNVIMRICDVLICIPGIPILLIISQILAGTEVPKEYRIYLMMFYLAFFSWPGTARLVRGQILSLREQEYMVAAEAMGYSVTRKIFKHLIPNVMPQLIVQMTLSLGSMILYESTLSYLQLGVPDPLAAWGSMIAVISQSTQAFPYLNVWVTPGICIVIAVLGFNFIGDGLRDALDPKMRR